MFGSWPIATKKPWPRPRASRRSRRCGAARPSTAVSPSTSSTTYGVRNSILSFARARLTMICEARNSSRRWTSVTFVPKRVRKSASSNAVSPPPTTTIVLLLEERAVAGRARGDAAALEALLGLEPEPARACAGRDDHRLRAVLVVVDPDAERALREVDLRHVVGDVLRAEALGLAAEVGHHLRAHDAVGVAGVVLDVARDHQLAAPLEALDHEGLQARRARVERRGVAGGAAADDDQLTYVVRGRSRAPPLNKCLSIKRARPAVRSRTDVAVRPRRRRARRRSATGSTAANSAATNGRVCRSIGATSGSSSLPAPWSENFRAVTRTRVSTEPTASL